MSQHRLLTYSILWAFGTLLGGPERLSAQGQPAERNTGQYQRADIEEGSRLFGLHCTACHGPNGDAVPGITLLNGRFRRALSDEDLRGIITDGIPGTAMPPGRV